MCHETLYQKAAVKSMATHTVQLGGFRWLKPVSMSVLSWRRADVVECMGLKPCCSLAGERNSLIEGKMSAQTTIPTNIHTANRIFTNIILMADMHNLPKGKMHSNCRLLPEDIVCTITQRYNIRRANTCDPALKLLNEEITSDIQKHKQNIWKEHLEAHWDHRHNTHTLWKTIHGLSNRAPPHTLNTSITFNN